MKPVVICASTSEYQITDLGTEEGVLLELCKHANVTVFDRMEKEDALALGTALIEASKEV